MLELSDNGHQLTQTVFPTRWIMDQTWWERIRGFYPVVAHEKLEKAFLATFLSKPSTMHLPTWILQTHREPSVVDKIMDASNVCYDTP